ncbi:MAG TPA: helix-turn-helix domain-containing protein [Bacteroides sp.]|nr:helix-turn-helix domain-containing protein [Bacteroides sp.]
MKHVAVLVPESSVLQAVADPKYCFGTVNRFLTASGRPPAFHVELVGARKKIYLNGNTYCVQTDRLLKEVDRTDLIIIPALFGEIKEVLKINHGIRPWLIEQYARGAELASLCTGAFLLASTGLLNGQKCSTHWNFTSQFRMMFPEVIIQEGSIVTDENRMYSSGGANSYWNLLMYLVEKITDRETAVLASKYFAIDISRNSQSPFALFRGQKEHQDEAVRRAQEYIESHIGERMTVDLLADELALGRRSFERRFRRATNNSVLEYIHRVKMEAAKRSLETSRKTIIEVMFEVGYRDMKAFRTIFRKITGLSPAAYRNQYNRSGPASA